MQRKNLFVMMVIMLGSIALLADVAIEPPIPKTLVNRGGDPCESYSHISGFSRYPDHQYYIVETIRDGSVLVVNPIKGDSVVVHETAYSLKPGITASKFISWDPILGDIKYGKEYKSRELRLDLPDLDRRGIDYGRVDSHSIEIPVQNYIGFERVDNYFDLQWYDPDKSVIYAEYELEWKSQTWQHPQFLIQSTGEEARWYHISDYLDEQTLDADEDTEFWEMEKKDLQALLDHVPTLSDWQLLLLEPLDQVKVYYHKSDPTSASRYSIPMRIPFAYKAIAIVLSALAGMAMLLLLYRVSRKGSRS